MWLFLCLKIEKELLKLPAALKDMIYFRGIVIVFMLRLVRKNERNNIDMRANLEILLIIGRMISEDINK